jgi:hypothetical protein
MKKKLLVTLGGLVLAAGCSPAMIHTDGPSKAAATPAAEATTSAAATTYTISDACRTELAGLPDGPAILSRYDSWFGYWQAVGNPADEVANTAHSFEYEATQAGASSCGTVSGS